MPLVFALPSGGRGLRAFNCLDCDPSDPMESEITKRWLDGELGRESPISGLAQSAGAGSRLFRSKALTGLIFLFG
jgi:hypothetical protein